MLATLKSVDSHPEAVVATSGEVLNTIAERLEITIKHPTKGKSTFDECVVTASQIVSTTAHLRIDQVQFETHLKPPFERLWEVHRSVGRSDHYLRSIRSQFEKHGLEIPRSDRSQADKRKTGTTRKWTDATGAFSVEAEFRGVIAGEVRLKKPDGELIKVPMENLSAEDQAWIRRR
jgi:hypothetical protein